MYLNGSSLVSQKIQNSLTSLFFLFAMVLLFSASGWYIFGDAAFLLAPLSVGVLYILGRSPEISRVLRVNNAIPLHYGNAPSLIHTVQDLSRKAGLPETPETYFIRSPIPNAMSMGTKQRPVIAVTSGLLSRLNGRELKCVLAHEISHIRNNDMMILTLAERLKRITMGMTYTGQVLLILNLPVFLFQGYGIPLPFLLTLIAAPLLSVLLQLALFRSREYSADFTAADLTGDPDGLASALKRLERRPFSILGLFFPVKTKQEAPFLRTHPPTEERLKRLSALKTQSQSRILSRGKFF